MATPIPATKRIDGMSGEVWSDLGTPDGSIVFQGDVIEISGAVRRDRREVPIPGTRNTQYKGGRVTREGSFRYQKVDDAREIAFLAQLDDLDVLRAKRDAAGGELPNVTFTLLINLDDPEAWGASKLQLLGCQMWEMPLGFSINDLVEREIPITWESEVPVKTITRP